MALESCCLRETERRAGALSSHSGPERVLLSQGGEAASPGPRFPEQKPPGSAATNARCPARSSCPLHVLLYLPGFQRALALTWHVPLAPINHCVFASPP